MDCKLLVLLFLTLAPALQNPAVQDGLTDLERSKIAGQQNIEGRIKVYQSASERYRTTLFSALKKQDYAPVPQTLESWSNLLTFSLQDIDKSIVNRKKKSKALIRYEIQLRKAISDVQALKTAAPVEIFDQLESWAKQADAVRQKFVQIIFPT
jgi:predicted nucleotide-binding protein (sugar kinase/HSP70/actin superfamily)